MFQSTDTVKSIFYINVAAFLITLLFPEIMYNLFSLHDPMRGYQFISYQFMHAGFLHIILNMVVLLSFGPAVEEIYGSKTMWIYYLLCGVIGAVFNMIMAGSGVPLVGASAAIWGIIVMYAFNYPEESLYMFFIPIPLKVKWTISVLFLFEIISSFSFSSNVSHIAHVGGGITGALLYFLHKNNNAK